MKTSMTLEVINKSDTDVELEESNAGVNRRLETVKGHDRCAIKLAANTTYREYLLVTKPVVDAGGACTGTLVISSDDCAEYKTIFIRNGLLTSKKLRFEKIKRGVSMTEVLNQTDRVFRLTHGSTDLEELKNGGEYSIQRDPKDQSNLDYVLVEDTGKKARLSISIQDLADYQRLTIVDARGVAELSKVTRGRYLMGVVNKTDIEFTVNCRGGDRSSDTQLATLQKDGGFTIDYDPTSGFEYWIESSSPTQTVPIKPGYFINSQRMDITSRSSSGEGAKLQSVRPRLRSEHTSKKSFWSGILQFAKELLGV